MPEGNPFPPAPDTYDQTRLREDTSAERVTDEHERRYRHHILSLFQQTVGAQDKPKIQLIVLDMKRVKMKWSHYIGTQGAVGSSVGESLSLGASSGEEVGSPVPREADGTNKDKKKRKEKRTEKSKGLKSIGGAKGGVSGMKQMTGAIQRPWEGSSDDQYHVGGLQHMEGVLGHTLETRTMREGDGTAKALVSAGGGAPPGVGASGVVALKIFKKKDRPPSDYSVEGKDVTTLHVESDLGNAQKVNKKKRKEYGATGTKANGKKSRLGVEETGDIDLLAVLGGAPTCSSVFGEDGRNMWN